MWARVSGRRGSYESMRASVGGEYDFDQTTVEGGLNVPLGGQAYGWVSARHVTGAADVRAPTGGGEIDAKALGFSFGLSLGRGSGFYAVGCGSFTDYDLGFSSDTRGLLASGVDGDGYSVSAEMGQRSELGGNTSLTVRAWVVRHSVAIGHFTDAVDSRVSYPESHRWTGGIGTVTEIGSGGYGEGFSLRVAVEAGRTFRGAQTVAWVSGETLTSRVPASSARVGLEDVYHRGRISLGAKLTGAQALRRADTRHYSGFLTLGLHFPSPDISHT